MLQAQLNEPGTFEALLIQPIWNQALAWLKTMPADVPLGIYELQGRDMYAWVQEYDTLPREQCRFESHHAYIDLQYTIHGSEAIDWHPRTGLQADGAFDHENDVQFYQVPVELVSSVVNSPGRFSIFFPCDAHRPKVRTGATAQVKKLVIKIHTKML